MTNEIRFTTITSKLGVYVDTFTFTTKLAAEKAAQVAIRCGNADSAAVWSNGNPVSYFGSGR